MSEFLANIKKRYRRTRKRLLGKAKRILKDLTLWHIFPARYRHLCKRPVEAGHAICLEGKETEMSDSFALVYERLKADPSKTVAFVSTNQNHVRYLIYCRNCWNALEEITRAEVVFLEDASDLVSCLPLRPETRIVQLWHACGAFKKWGMSCTEKKFGDDRASIERHPFYKNLSLVTVSSPEVRWAYAEAMDLERTPEIIQPLGVSRTDVFFDEAFLAGARAKVEEAFPEAAGRKIILYAPTFRGHVKGAKGPDALDIEAMCAALGDEYKLIIKHHPFVKHPPRIPAGCEGFAHLVRGDLTIDELLCAADVCITDYSSIVFEWSLFERPILFFAYDRDDYDDWRGFYYPYEEFTPGPVVTTTEQVIDCIEGLGEGFDPSEVHAFKERFMCACDGHATDRILAAAFPEDGSEE